MFLSSLPSVNMLKFEDVQIRYHPLWQKHYQWKYLEILIYAPEGLAGVWAPKKLLFILVLRYSIFLITVSGIILVIENIQ